jgi:hypothetical protein
MMLLTLNDTEPTSLATLPAGPVTIDEDQLFRLFAGVSSWPSLDDRLLEAAFRIMQVSIEPNDLAAAGIELGCQGMPWFRADAPLAMMLCHGILDAHGGLRMADSDETTWAISAPIPGTSLGSAVTVPGCISVIDPEYRLQHRGSLQKEYLDRQRFGSEEDWMYRQECRRRLETQCTLQIVERSLELLLDLAGSVTEQGQTVIDFDFNAVNDDGQLRDALTLLQTLRFARAYFDDDSWRPRLIQEAPAIECCRWIDDGQLQVAVHPEMVDIVRHFCY